METSEHQGKRVHLVPKSPQGGINKHLHPAGGPLVLWHHSGILAFLNQSGGTVMLLNKFSFIWMHMETIKTTKKKQNTSLLKKNVQPCQAGGFGWVLWHLLVKSGMICRYVQGSISFLCDSCDRWQCEMASEGERRVQMGVGGLLQDSRSPDWVQWRPQRTPTQLFKGLALLQCESQVKNVFILNLWLNLCNNKETKAYFSEWSRFMWLSLLFQDPIPRDRGLLCSSGWSPTQDPLTTASGALGVQCHRAQRPSRFLTEGMHKIFPLLTETRLFNVSLKYLF